jgi:hypothetical protein
VALGSGSAVQRIILSPGDRLFDEGKVIAKQFLGLRASDIRSSQLTDAMAISAVMKTRAVVAAYSVMVIGPAPIDWYFFADLAREPNAARVLLSPFWAGAAHIMQLGPIGAE